MSFFSRYKRFFLLLGFTALIFIIGYFIWQVFFKSTALISPPDITPPGTPGEFPSPGPSTPGEYSPGEDGGLPGITDPNQAINPRPGDPSLGAPSEVALGGKTIVTPINPEPSLGITLNQGGNLQYYDRSSGLFYKLNPDGSKTTLSDRVFHSVRQVTWAKRGDKAILTYPDGNKIVYDFNSQKQVTLPSHWEDFSFSADGERIAAKNIGYDSSDSWLIAANADGSRAVGVEPIGDRHPYVYPSWSPAGQIVALNTEGVSFDRQEVFFVGLNGENFKSTIIEGRNFQSQWSPEGEKLLYSVYSSRDNYSPRLWVVNAQVNTIGENRHQLGLMTWSNKCAFASETDLYCAVPAEMPEGAGMFPSLADEFPDTIYKIDLTTGGKKIIAIPDGFFNVSQMVVSEDQDYLYFLDKYSGTVNEIKLSY